MTAPTNTYTVTFEDAHSHTFVAGAIPGSGGNTMAGKMDALLNALNGIQATAAAGLSAFTAADTLTVTVTQP
jgi:hypothetical protein